MKIIQLITTAILISKVTCGFDPTSNANIVYYWGQNSASVAGDDPTHALWQKPLSDYCTNAEVNILVISFLHKFGEGRSTSFDIANNGKDCLGYIPGTELLNCPNMEADIKLCQANDKKVLLSMGGATPEYGLQSIQEGENLADELWNTFGGGNGLDRPFGNVSVDGFDLDIENGAKVGYPAFVKRMREHYEKDESKEYYIAAAPQCPFPDLFLSETLDSSWFDFVMIQFYNNYCNVINGEQFNYNVWDEWSKHKSINRDVRLFVGVPGSPSAAGRGYVPFDILVKTIKPLQDLSSFGGVMVWDVSQAYGNKLDVLPSYAHGVARLVHGHMEEDELSSILDSNTTTTTTTTTAIANKPPVSVESSSPVIAKPKAVDIPTTDKEMIPTDIKEQCNVNGMLKCVGKTSYGQCTHGSWVIRSCPIVTVCKQNNDSVYCGFS